MSIEQQLLMLWERGYNASPIERALLMTSLAAPELSPDAVLDLPVGYRDGRLLALRRTLLGDQVTSTVPCQHCQTRLELSFDLEPMIAIAQSYSLMPFSIDWQDQRLAVRCPTTRDILGIANEKTDSPSSRLLRRCVPQSAEIESELSANPNLQQALVSAIEQHDPLGDVEFSLHCGQCERDCSARFDIVSFLWTEINAWCQRLMSDIHVLARTYGWSEPEILRLGPWRRQVYLNMIRQ